MQSTSFSNNFVDDVKGQNADFRSIVNSFLNDKERTRLATTTNKSYSKYKFPAKIEIEKVKYFIGSQVTVFNVLNAIEYATHNSFSEGLNFALKLLVKLVKQDTAFLETITTFLFFKLINLISNLTQIDNTPDSIFELQSEIEDLLISNPDATLPGGVNFPLNFKKFFDVVDLLNATPPKFEGLKDENVNLMHELFEVPDILRELQALRDNGLDLEYLPLFENIFNSKQNIGNDSEYSSLNVAQRKNLKRRSNYYFSDDDDDDDDEEADEVYDDDDEADDDDAEKNNFIDYPESDESDEDDEDDEIDEYDDAQLPSGLKIKD